MYYCLIGRYELLNYLPKGGVVAEVGVYRGNFSAHVLDRVCPERYYLIDTWLLNQDSAYADQLRFLPEHDGEIVHAEVQSRFSREIASGQVSMVRRSSLDAASSFVRKTFDW